MEKKHFLVQFTILIVMAIFSINVLAQKSIFLENNKLYVKDSLPVYFFIADNPEGKNPVLLQSASKHANPMYFDGHGNHYLYHKDLFLEEEVRFDFLIDGIAPVTHIDFTSDKRNTHNNTLYLAGDIKIILKATDEMSGVAKTFYSIDGANYQEYKDAISLAQEKDYTLHYYSIDRVGNIEVVKTKKIATDVTPPQSNHEYLGVFYDNVLPSSGTIKITATDANVGVQKIMYSIDGKQETVYTNPIKVLNLTEGEHQLTYYAIDKVGNIENKKTIEFYVDKTPPVVVEEILGNSFMLNGKEYTSGRSQLKLTAIDNRAGVKEIFYSINNGPFQTYTEPVYLSKNAGSISLKSYAVDNVGNKSTSNIDGSKSNIPYIDLSGPNLSYEIQGNTFKTRDTIFVSSNSKIVLKAYDNESGLNKIVYSVDKGAEQTYTAPFTVPKAGMCHVSFTAYDNVGNSNSTEFKFKVDNTGPSFYYRFSTLPLGTKDINGKKLEIYPSYVMLYLSSTDNEVGSSKIFYKTNNEAEKLYGTYIQGFTKGKTYHIKIRATDLLGNQSEGEVEFVIDSKQ